MAPQRWMDALPPLETVLTPEVIAIALMAAQTLWSQSLMAPTLALKYELRAAAGIVAWRKQLDPDGQTDRRPGPSELLNKAPGSRVCASSAHDLWRVLDKIRYARHTAGQGDRGRASAALILREAEAILRERHHERQQQADHDA
jgi:hypothetical protein